MSEENPEFDDVADNSKRQRLEATLAEFKGFFGTKLHQLFIEQTQLQLTEVIDIILDPNTTDFGTLRQFKGQKDILSSNLSLFEDAAQTLKDRIEKLLELENQTEQNE